MYKQSRKIDLTDPDSSFRATKKQCTLTSPVPPAQNRKRQIQLSESIIWPESEDNLFSNAQLDNLITNAQTLSSQISSSSNGDGGVNSGGHNLQSQSLFENDSLFGDFILPEEADQNVGGTPLAQVLPSANPDIDSDDSFFSEINLDELTASAREKTQKEETPNPQYEWEHIEVDLFAEPAYEVDALAAIQNTQKFLADVVTTFKMPQIPTAAALPSEALVSHNSDDSFVSKSILEGCVQGTQYATREQIQNDTKLEPAPFNQTHSETIAGLAHMNWETQAFSDIVKEEHQEEVSFPSKGDFYGLPDRVRRMIFEHKGIKSLYEWQDECLNLPAIRKRKNLIYALPTSGGKTLVAEILMLREIICRQKNVLFVLPYVSIVQEKVSAMSPFAIALDFIIDEYTAGKGKCPPVPRQKRKSMFIASIEKGAVMLDSLIDAKRANEIGLVVVDELHLIGEKGRGATLEALLTKVMFLNANIQIVGMSATIGNLGEISAFLNADVYTRGFRPVELKEYIKCGNDILEINTTGKTLEEIFIYRRTLNFKYSAAVARSDPDHLAGLVSECAPENCCLIFCSTRKNCENVSVLLSRILPKSKFLEHRKSEKADLMDALDKVCGILSPVLAKTIPYGIAYHHSGLTTDERKFIETAYRFGVISVICCTSTLAAGVNLPAKRVIIRAPYVGSEFMTLCKYKQMVGRAGRAGMGEAGESFLISAGCDNLRVGQMLFSPMDKAITSLDFQNGVGLQSLILSAIGLEIASCRLDLYRLIASTLLAVQSAQLGISTDKLILDIVREMFKNKVLQINDKRNDTSDILTTQDLSSSRKITQGRRLVVSKLTRFELTTIGRAAFKAGIDYKRTYAIYHELQAAQAHLILSNYAHLLYLVVAFNSNAKGDELFAADAAILFRSYELLTGDMRKLFNLLGFTEAHAVKLATTLSLSGSMELRLNRLFKVLILVDFMDIMPLPSVAAKYNIERGTLQNLIGQSTSAASAIVRLCEQVPEFWCFKPLFERIGAKMDRCGTAELEPLLDLPAVKINRAKQLYAAGFKTIEDIAKCRPMELVKSVEHMPLKIAKEIISAAKIILMKKLDYLEEETEALKMCLKHDDKSQ